MIFHRALLREFAGLAGAVFMTLFAIALTTRLIRLLGQAAFTLASLARLARVHDPHVGDHDARLEDRQLLLDALMSASDHVLITYSGKDERTNAPRPPAVPVGELLDVVDRTVRVPDGRARDRIVGRGVRVDEKAAQGG